MQVSSKWSRLHDFVQMDGNEVLFVDLVSGFHCFGDCVVVFCRGLIVVCLDVVR